MYLKIKKSGKIPKHFFKLGFYKEVKALYIELYLAFIIKVNKLYTS